eukprot:TRINITY_DN16133_c0_g1_i1.p1 TRINITY_DN16133_c0_g1~~TRINITY_DN16133_c0_g1_i1.p1  ORF type:complete len:572 (-),score=115.77 TRINITY_DN16133_c0_g1_i1:359-2074(-)
MVVLSALLLMINNQPPDLVLLAATITFVVTDTIKKAQAWEGFSSTSVLSIGVLFVVARALEESGTIQLGVKYILGNTRSVPLATLQMAVPVALCSAFVNDTPVVVMMMPIVDQWSAKLNIPKQKLLMPLSFAALLGGMCTLIGTSTNLVLQGIVDKDTGPEKVKLDFFTMTPVGAPVALCCCCYMAIFGQWILPDGPNDGGANVDVEQRSYMVCFVVGRSYDGQTLDQLGLTRVPGASLPGVDTERTLQEGDVLEFCCTPRALLALCRQDGLAIRPLDPLHHELGNQRRHRCLIEVVLSHHSPLVGSLVESTSALPLYEAAVLAAHRVRSKDDKFRAGDTLLLEGFPRFDSQHGGSDQFLLCSLVVESTPHRGGHVEDGLRKYGAAIILVAMVSLVAAKVLDIFVASLMAAFLLVGMQCITVNQGFRAIKGRVILAILFCYGLGHALDNTGVTQKIAEGFVTLGKQLGSIGSLFLVFLVCACLSCIVSNQATVQLLYPIVKNMDIPGCTLAQFVVILIMGASSSFMTPFGYQTNLMVWPLGRYAFLDYTKFGAPLTILVGIVSAVLAHYLI